MIEYRYLILVKPQGDTGYELVREEYAYGNTPRTALAAARAVARSYELEGHEVTIVKVKGEK